jgi:hypothetical protein
MLKKILCILVFLSLPAIGAVVIKESTVIYLNKGTTIVGMYPGWDECRTAALALAAKVTVNTDYYCYSERRHVTATIVSSSSSSSSSTSSSSSSASAGNPGTTPFNDLVAISDPFAHSPKHGTPAVATSLPPGLAPLAAVADIQVLTRRDATILYFSSVAGAADYRAYAVTPSVTFVNGQPRGAVIACAGFRQHAFESSLLPVGNHTRQLMQAIEVPGFVTPGKYTVVLEALQTPCPFPGMPGHTDATITGHNFHADDPNTYTYTGTHYAKFVSAATVLKNYGNEIINGQGAASGWDSRMTAPIGLPAPASDPVVIARSALLSVIPSADENTNAPVIDVGPNAIEDDFVNDLVVDPATYTTNPDYAGGSAASSAPMFSIPGAWQFWARYIQLGDGQTGVINGQYNPQGSLGLQVFQRHGRLYTTFGDGGQDVGGSIAFASSKVTPQPLDATKYIHSLFRINSEGTQRRYWTWTLCGGASPGELQDPATHVYKIRPVFYESSFAAASPGFLYADNPSMPQPPVSAVTPDKALNPAAKECLSIAEDGMPEYPRTDSLPRSSAVIRAQIHPAGYAKGIIALGNALSEPGTTLPGFRYKLDAAGKQIGPVFESFDQINPLTHYDFFVRPDRLVVFINGRQAFCVDMSDRPLTMKYGMISYGQLLYHSALEWQNISQPQTNGYPSFASQNYQIILNQPIADSRAWDVIGETGLIDMPTQFVTFDATLCRKPMTVAIQ